MCYLFVERQFRGIQITILAIKQLINLKYLQYSLFTHCLEYRPLGPEVNVQIVCESKYNIMILIWYQSGEVVGDDLHFWVYC